MTKLIWDKPDERIFETGVSKGVLYPQVSGKYLKGVVWNGLTAVTESPEGAEPNPLYADNIKYLNLLSAEDFKATVEAYTYPDEFAECNGEKSLVQGVTVGQQKRSPFGLCYQTKIGDAEDSEKGYKINIIYGALAAPSEKAYATVNDSPEAITFSWELSTTPVEVTNAKPSAHLVIDTTKLGESASLDKLEEALYGTTDKEAWLPLPDEVVKLLDGTYVAG